MFIDFGLNLWLRKFFQLRFEIEKIYECEKHSEGILNYVEIQARTLDKPCRNPG
jgi:hypothetical protein